jgi:hypothetical protein
MAGKKGAKWAVEKRRSAVDRFMDFVSPEPNTGCWLWAGAVQRDGYGRFTVEKRLWMAHRWAYEMWAGPILAGLQLDHTCATPGCVNPKHLRTCTAKENMLAPHTAHPARLNSEKTHCKHGHELTPKNTYHYPHKNSRGCRICRTIERRLRRGVKRPRFVEVDNV